MASAPLVSDEQMAAMGRMLSDRAIPVAKRFRLIFTLRNLGGNRAVDALISGSRRAALHPRRLTKRRLRGRLRAPQA